MVQMLKQFWNDERGIEGLPLKYIIAVLVAAIVVGIIVSMTGILKKGVYESSEQVSNRTKDMVTRSLEQANKTI